MKLLSGEYLLTQWIGHIIIFFHIHCNQKKRISYLLEHKLSLLFKSCVIQCVSQQGYWHAERVTKRNVICFLWQMNQREMEVKNRVCAVALTDSAHNIWLQETSKGTQDWMHQVKKKKTTYSRHAWIHRRIGKQRFSKLYRCTFLTSLSSCNFF